MPMPVFIILVVIFAAIVWYLCAKFFATIGEKAQKSAKPFTEANSENKQNEGDNQNVK